MDSTAQLIHWIAAFVVFAESLNKLERTAPCAQGLSTHDSVVQWLKAIAWLQLAAGSAWVVFAPALEWLGFTPSQPLDKTINDISGLLVMLGFATLIFRTRVKEG